MNAAPAIATHRPTKRYGGLVAVSDLALTVRRGEVYGFLGLNGAGKTTTIRMLLGLIRPTAGSLEVLGTPVHPGTTGVLASVGYLVENATAYLNLSVTENLAIQQRLTGAPAGAVAAIIDLLGLSEYATVRASTLSQGNRQRLALARAMLHRPRLLILDEPANGLDPAGIVEIRSLLRRLAIEEGVTVFMSSHVLGEVAQLADRIGIIHRGVLIEELDLRQLLSQKALRVRVSSDDPQRVAAVLTGVGLGPARVVGSGVDVSAQPDRVPEIARALLEAGVAFTAIAPVQEDLESHFLRATGAT